MIKKDKVLICYNEPASIYENYLGKSANKNEVKIDLSENEFLNQIENIKNSLEKKFEQVSVLSIGKNIPDALKR